MKILSKDFTKRDGGTGVFRFKQVKREADIALYEKSPVSRPTEVSYEVIRVQHHDGFKTEFVNADPSEYYPNGNSWGTLGFTYKNKNQAEKKYKELLNQQSYSEHTTIEEIMQSDDTEIQLETGATNTAVDITARRAGRKRKETGFTHFPINEEFTVKGLAEKYKVSIPYISTRIAAAKLQPVRKQSTGGRGKPSSVYKLDTLIAVPNI